MALREVEDLLLADVADGDDESSPAGTSAGRSAGSRRA
jgi:hypothetical protein